MSACARERAARHSADIERRLGRERGAEAERVGARDEHEVRPMGSDPPPQRVGLAVLAVRDSRRRELQRRADQVDF